MLLFGGCPPGATLTVDAQHLHYDEIGILGSYHYRPAEYRQALEELSRGSLPASRLDDRYQVPARSVVIVVDLTDWRAI